jgi:hypothetical protein
MCRKAAITNGELFTLASIASGIEQESIAHVTIVIARLNDPGIYTVTSENHSLTRQLLDDAMELFEDDSE